MQLDLSCFNNPTTIIFKITYLIDNGIVNVNNF